MAVDPTGVAPAGAQFSEQRRDLPQLVHDRAPGRLGGMRGQHRADLEAGEEVGELVPVDDLRHDRLTRLDCSGEAVDLFGNVDEVEVDAQRAHDLTGCS